MSVEVLARAVMAFTLHACQTFKVGSCPKLHSCDRCPCVVLLKEY